MKLIEFNTKFQKEEDCIEYFRKFKEKNLSCKKCGHTQHYWLRNKLAHECKKCRKRVSIRTDTALSYTKLSFLEWFLAIHLSTSTKKGFSAKEIQRQMGRKRYEPIFKMLHKIREAFHERDATYMLSDMVEIDDAYISTATKSKDKSGLKRGKGSQKQSKVTTMIESFPLQEIDSQKIDYKLGYVKLIYNPSEKSSDIEQIVGKNVNPISVLFSDNSNAYLQLNKYVDRHIAENSADLIEQGALRWTHTLISNCKRNILGVYHSISEKHIQNYLSEFTYKINRRYFKDIFQRAIIAMVFRKVCG